MRNVVERLVKLEFKNLRMALYWCNQVSDSLDWAFCAAIARASKILAFSNNRRFNVFNMIVFLQILNLQNWLLKIESDKFEK